jgi:hypothetical protein
MVNVAVGVHGTVERKIAPASNFTVDQLGGEWRAGVNHDKTVVGRYCRAVREVRKKRHALSDLADMA